MSINDINEALNIDLASDNYDTIGGFVVNLMGTIPNEEDHPVLEFEGMKFKIEKVNEKRIEKLIISLKNAPDEPEAPPSEE